MRCLSGSENFFILNIMKTFEITFVENCNMKSTNILAPDFALAMIRLKKDYPAYVKKVKSVVEIVK